MANSPEDDRGGATAAAPDPGTTDAGAEAAAQGAEGGTPPAPDPGTTEDDVLHAGASAEVEGAAESEDTETALRDKLSHLQPRHDALATAARQLRERYPNDFDEKGNLKETAATDDESVLHAGEPAAEPGGGGAAPAAEPAAPTGNQFGFDALSADPEQARLTDLNQRALAALYEDENLVGPVRTIVMDAMAQMGLTPEMIQAFGQGRPGMDEAQMQEFTTKVAREQIQSHQVWREQWSGQVEACAAAFSPDFLGKLIDWPDTPKMTIEKALPRLCRETGEENPYWALLKHKATGPVAHQILVKQQAEELASKMVAAGGGMQLIPGGGGFPGPATAGTDDIEAIGGSSEPLKR